MRSVRACAMAVVAVWAAAIVVGAQSKISTPAEFDTVMKGVGKANGQLQEAVKSGAFADGKAALATIRQNFALAETFWVANKKDEAVKLTQDAAAKAAALDKALGASAPDAAAVTAAFKELGATCRNCHMGTGGPGTGWRVRDAEGNYSINPEKMK
jgi:cytochrome c556